MTQNELMHYGVKGMRWGVRKKFVGPTQPVRTRLINKLPSDNKLSNTKTISDQSRSGVEAVRGSSNVVSRNRYTNKSKTESSKMTNEQLKEKIQRMSLEQQYANLNANQISKGRANVDTALQVAGGALAVTSSALGIALAIKQLKG